MANKSRSKKRNTDSKRARKKRKIESLKRSNTSTEDEQANTSNEPEPMDVSNSSTHTSTHSNESSESLPELIIESPEEKYRRESFHPSTKTHHIVGRRIIHLKALELGFNNMISHGQHCSEKLLDPSIVIIEDKPIGLRSNLKMMCNHCSWEFTMDTERESNSLDINEAIVQGVYAGGTHYNAMHQMLTLMDIPTLNVHHFRKNELIILEKYDGYLLKQLEENGQQEHRLAKEEGDTIINDGVEYGKITVTGDGGWAKRTYGHSYNSLGGVGVIIGVKTKKMLHLGIRNKYCIICKRAFNQNKSPIKHLCFKNYPANKSSTSMEADIMAKGFSDSMSAHKLIYENYVGDGDSSVLAKLTNLVKYPDNISIKKIECVNHVTRCLNTGLLKIIKDTTYPIAHRELLKSNYLRFQTALKQAIKHHSANRPITNHDTLKEEILNIPNHIFGSHLNCQDRFCTRRDLEKDEDSFFQNNLNSPMIKRVQELIFRPANFSLRLIPNLTSNICESFMSKAAKINISKSCNTVQRQGYHLRMTVAALSFDKGPNFYVDVYRSTSNEPPSILWNIKKRNYEVSKASKKKVFKPRYKGPASKISLSGHVGDADYGTNPIQPEYEISHSLEEFKTLCQEYYEKNSTTTSEKAEEIEESTRPDDAYRERWKKERFGRITASISGEVFHLKDSSNNSNIIKRILQLGSNLSTPAIQHGIDNEKFAREKYCSEKGLKTSPCGLYICREQGFGFLAATPDDLVGETGIVEYKSPHSMINYAPETMPEVKKDQKKSSYLEKINGNVQLKRSSNYYYQCVMQLNVTQKEFLDFCVYSFKIEDDQKVEFPLFIERIRRAETQDLWEKMKAKFLKFYREDLIPELVDSQMERLKPPRIPEYRKLAIQKKEEEKIIKDRAAEERKIEKAKKQLETENKSKIQIEVDSAESQ